MVPGVAGSIPVGHPASESRKANAAEVRSSIGRAPVSKTGGWGFDSLRACDVLVWVKVLLLFRRGLFAVGIDPTAVSSRGLGHGPLKAGTRVRIPLPLLLVVLQRYCSFGPIVYRLGRDPFKVQRRVRLPLGLWLPVASRGVVGDGAVARVRLGGVAQFG